jgi:hypothetical protein
MSVADNKYAIVRKAISGDLLRYVQINAEIHENASLIFNRPTPAKPFPYGDEQTPNSFAWYSPVYTESLMVLLRPMIAKICNKELSETYTYTRSYYNGAILEKHVDRPSCEYSATICIEKGECDWPIYFETENGIHSVELENGDLVVYSGTILPHWREPYAGDRHRQVFLHYVDINGKWGLSNRYDTRNLLGLPSVK